MTDKGRPDDDDDEQETHVGDASTPDAGGTEGEFGLDDLESLPGKRVPAAPKTPVPASKSPPRRSPPDADDSFDDRPETSPAGFESSPPRTPPSPDATMADAAAVPSPPSPEAPTREMDLERELPTIVGSFAASKVERRPASDEMETVADVGDADATNLPATGAEPSGGTSAKPPGRFVSPLSKAASRTARDPIVGSAASRASTPGSASAGPHTLAEGQLLADRYELIERLGKGGMGEVWKAKHILLQGHRAIKVIKASISRDPAFRQRFLQEGQTMMRVKHPGVVEVTDLDETRSNRELFMVMEYLKGRTIYDAVRDKQKPLSGDVRDAVRVLREVALGMQRIHDERIVHKDLKSDNVLLVVGDDGKEHPKVIDFGLAKRLGDKDGDVEHPGAASPPPGYDPDLHTTLSGTLAYMAPEQFRNQPSSFQSDIYAFGVMAYEVFAGGEFPLPRGSLLEYMKLHEAGKPPDVLAKKRPDLDPHLTAIFDHCLAMKREARPESFQSVADRLQFWLDTPEREARKRRLIYTYAAASALVGAAVWGIFFSGKKTASLSPPKLLVAGVERPFKGIAHLRGEDIAALQLAAGIEGKPENPVVEIDGKRHEGAWELRDKTLFETVNLTDLTDAEHALTWRAAPDASPVKLTIAVDRVPPKVRGVSVKGAVTTGKGVFTNSDAPIVVVDIDEPASGIADVYALAADRMKSPGEQEQGADRFVIKGTAPGDGKVEFDVIVHDLAGNETTTKFAYVRDTKPPVVGVRDYFKRQGYNGAPSLVGAWVRSANDSKLIVAVDKPATVVVTFGGQAPVERRIDARGEIELEVPPIPDAGLAAKLVVRDTAGNETSMSFPVTVVPDVVSVMRSDTKHELVIKADDAQSASIVVVFRTYPLGEALRLWSTPIRTGVGTDVADGAARELKLSKVRDEPDGLTKVFGIAPHALDDGVYRITATVAEAAECEPLTVTVNSAVPVVESVRVEDASTRREIALNGWALARDVVVTAVVSDLSLSRVGLDGTSPQEPIGPGRRTYTFVKRLEHEGTTTWTLALTDAAGHQAEKSITVHGDWTAPEVASLDSPTNGAVVDDISPVKFVGRCSEATYRLMIEGLPGGAALEANCIAEDFKQSFSLPPTDGPVALRVVAVDPAGHRSEPKIVTLTVVHRAAIRASEITWTRGVDVKMRKVEAGDVVLSACAQPVSEVFLDKTEVTNAQYRAFLAAAKDGDAAWRHAEQPQDWSHVPSAATWNDAKWNADDLPVVNVAYWDAYAFAKWSGRRLPSEAEWVKAAAKSSAKGEIELRQWPPFSDGEEWRNGVLATSESVKGPVSALSGDDVSPCGCLHMGGNVSEWVDLSSPSAEGGSPAGTRGGNWFFTKRAADVRNTPGKQWDRSFRANTIGFRCAVDADQVQQ